MTTQIDIRGTVTECAPTVPPTCAKWVYQKVAPGAGNISNGGLFDRQRRAHVIPADPKTPAQLARRAKFATAIATWKTLTPEQREYWQTRGKTAGLPAYNAFLSDYMKAP